MDDTIRYYMWGFQKHFQLGARDYAKKIFTRFSKDLIPHIFLLGILRKEEDLPICVEPEECGISVDHFLEIDKLANTIHQNDPRKNMIHTLNHVHENYHENLRTECLVKAIQEIVDAHFLPMGKISFVSNPVRVVLVFPDILLSMFSPYSSITEIYLFDLSLV